jgi:8-oxo-dGTP pyrophosphatase MutT (NUDIX family)
MDEPRGAAVSTEGPETRAAPDPLPAATVVLVRGSQPAGEVLLLRRPMGSAFAPDTWVFPGGRVDPSDHGFDHARLAEGPAPDEWARILSLENPREAAAYAVAAVRETWEETGILLAAGERPPGCEAARRELLSGSRSLQEFLEVAGLRIASGALRYVAHWITPEWLPRRFDTRFFLCHVGHGAQCVLEGDELVEHRWLEPGEALVAAEAGEITLLPPTSDTLRRLAQRRI